uniref:GTPase-activating protein and VPS9 domain-containing protein 1-like n=1 Tax=Phallusia mammillata TaxID=59560 RepID=A0A6F9DDC5_9ASCI|nr:GTPase-activating protein and VPS9 domain-containing protein 1-like [Phallusia mammillata]
MSNLQELAQKLHEENQFVKSEQDLIWKLNEQVHQHSDELSHLFWVTRQHYLNLNRLVLNQAQASCSQRANQLEAVQFVDAYKELGYQESMYSQFIEAFIHNPTLAAACLAYGDKLGLEATTDVARTIVLCCYGNNFVTDNHKYLLELMETLMLLQLANEEQPRRLLQKGSCAFCVVFRLFVESLTAGKLFLTSALHQPIMEVLMDDELFLETNQSKILTRLTAHEVEKRFGQQDDPTFKDKLKEHINKTEQDLVVKCSSFVNSLLSAMCCFPTSLGWIITRAYNIVKDSGLVSQTEARALCTDFLLQHFVCPTIVNPELYGVTGDVPVSEITRFNLMQIAQVLQVMAHWDGSNQQPDPVYSRLNRDPMHQLIDIVINSNCDEVLSQDPQKPGSSSTSVFFTASQLTQLIQFLRDIQQSNVRGVDQSSLADILSHLPSQPPACMVRAATQPVSSTSDDGSQHKNNGQLTSSGGSAGDLMGMLNNNSTPQRKAGKRATKAKNKSPRRADSASDLTNDESASGDSTPQHLAEQTEVVLIISLPSLTENAQDMPGTLTETEVMEMHKATSRQRQNIRNTENGQLDENEGEGLEKRSRFSLYSGASDLSEPGEELRTEDGISRTSGSSSMDLDQTESVPPDDGSSIHAGSSHGNQDEDDDEEEGGDQESVTHVNNDEALKALSRKLPTARESIEDKMRKFEIRQELGVRFADSGMPGPRRDDQNQPGTADTKSETWSVDVYASDSEPPAEQESQSERLREIAEDPVEHIRSPSMSIGSFLALTRDEDSRSDVWSVEVLPSDSEPPDIQSDVRLQELESESVQTQAEDAMEDNRSRASTPSLSAASGFSGVSAMSDNTQAKPAEEHQHWSGFKGPSSISPDAEDLLNREGGSAESSHGGGSSNSSEVNDRSRPHSSSPRYQENVNQSPVPMVMSKRNESDSKTKKDEKVVKITEPSSEKTVAWNIPEQNEDTSDSPVSTRLPVMDFDEHINTIKRSPYKKHNKPSLATDKNSPNSASQTVYAWDEKTSDEARSNPSLKVNGLEQGDSAASPSSMVNHDPSSAFLPVKTSGNGISQEVLDVFDPLSSQAESTNGQSKEVTKKQSADQTSNNDYNLTASTNTLTENSTESSTAPKTRRSETRPHPPPESRPKNPHSPNLARSVSADFEPHELVSRSGGRVDRKKSWWKGNRLTFGKRKGPFKYNSAGAGGNDVAGAIPKVGSFESFSSNNSLEESSPAPVKQETEQKSAPGDDIMQKYMKKVSTLSSQQSSTNGENPDASGSDLNDSQNLSGSTATTAQSPHSDDTVTTATRGASSTSSAPFVGDWRATSSGETGKQVETFKKSDSELKRDAKRKLRIVLSSTKPTSQIMTSPGTLMTPHRSVEFILATQEAFRNQMQSRDQSTIRDQLLSFLRIQHAEAMMLQDHSRMAKIHEVIRCIDVLDDPACRSIFKRFNKKKKIRSSYHTYLVRSRQHLLAMLSYLEHVTMCTKRDRSICRRYFTSQCVRLFLKRRESHMLNFRHKFVRSSAMDDKVALVDSFLTWLSSEMADDVMWEGAGEEQLNEAAECVERSIFTHIYKPVLFPNGDGDILRDQLFHQHISRLSAVITPAHSSLLIRRKYLLESPWPSAQREASAIAAHRSPKGKLDSALRCCRAVMHLLKLADESEAPGADDFTPVLVFVLIKANPPHLLSTVQFVNSFLGERLSGEEAYWWMQFTAATEFIKTIDERK